MSKSKRTDALASLQSDLDKWFLASAYSIGDTGEHLIVYVHERGITKSVRLIVGKRANVTYVGKVRTA